MKAALLCVQCISLIMALLAGSAFAGACSTVIDPTTIRCEFGKQFDPSFNCLAEGATLTCNTTYCCSWVHGDWTPCDTNPAHVYDIAVQSLVVENEQGLYHPEVTAMNILFIQGMCEYSLAGKEHLKIVRRFYNSGTGAYAELIDHRDIGWFHWNRLSSGALGPGLVQLRVFLPELSFLPTEQQALYDKMIFSLYDEDAADKQLLCMGIPCVVQCNVGWCEYPSGWKCSYRPPISARTHAVYWGTNCSYLMCAESLYERPTIPGVVCLHNGSWSSNWESVKCEHYCPPDICTIGSTNRITPLTCADSGCTHSDCCLNCTCNGHSNSCSSIGDTSTICLNCGDNTIGPHCDVCDVGYAISTITNKNGNSVISQLCTRCQISPGNSDDKNKEAKTIYVCRKKDSKNEKMQVDELLYEKRVVPTKKGLEEGDVLPGGFKLIGGVLYKFDCECVLSKVNEETAQFLANVLASTSQSDTTQSGARSDRPVLIGVLVATAACILSALCVVAIIVWRRRRKVIGGQQEAREHSDGFKASRDKEQGMEESERLVPQMCVRTL